MAGGRIIGGGNSLWLYTFTNYTTTPTIGATAIGGGSFNFTRKTTINRDANGARWTLELDQIRMDSDLITLLETYTSTTAAPVEEVKFEDGTMEPGYTNNSTLFAIVAGAIDQYAGSPSYNKRLGFAFPCVLKNDTGSMSFEYGKYMAPKFMLESFSLAATFTIPATYLVTPYFTSGTTVQLTPSAGRFGKLFYV